MAFRINKSLASRIVFYVLVFCIFLFIISLLLFYFFSKKSIKEITYENAVATTQKTAFKTEQVLQTTEKILQNWKWQLENCPFSDDSIMAFTQAIVRSNPEILGCAIAFEPGYFPGRGRYFSPYTYRDNDSVKSVILGSSDFEYFVMDWYQIPATIGEPYWAEPYYDTGGSDALITTYSVPFYKNAQTGGKEFSGIITIDLDLAWLTEIVSSVRILETGYASVISRNGTFVTHPNLDLIMNQTIFSYAFELGSPELREIGRDMQVGNSGFVSVSLNNINWIISYTPLPTSKWALAVVFPKAEMYAPLMKITIVLVILIIIGLSLLTYIITKIVARQVAPLGLFARSAHEVAEGNFDAPLPEVKTEDEMNDLYQSFVKMQKDLKIYIENLKETTSAKEKIESELRIAREIQMGMVPKIFPPFPEIKEIDLYAMLEPAKEVGGDLYDFFMVDEGHLCIAIGDVSGKGVPASLFMAVTRTLLRSVAPKQRSPKFIVDSLNKSLAQGNESNMFVTFFLGIVNIHTGQLKYVNAGHNPPVRISVAGKPEMLEITSDIPIGLFAGHDYTEKEIIMSVSEQLFLYTDGVTEAENCRQELYSEKRLMKCLSEAEVTEPQNTIRLIAADVRDHVQANQQSDDLTMLSVIYYGK